MMGCKMVPYKTVRDCSRFIAYDCPLKSPESLQSQQGISTMQLTHRSTMETFAFQPFWLRKITAALAPHPAFKCHNNHRPLLQPLFTFRLGEEMFWENDALTVVSPKAHLRGFYVWMEACWCLGPEFNPHVVCPGLIWEKRTKNKELGLVETDWQSRHEKQKKKKASRRCCVCAAACTVLLKLTALVWKRWRS